MAEFRTAISKVLRHEGVEIGADGYPVPGRTGLVNHPDDPGGETNFGIKRQVANENGYTGPMRDIPLSTVLAIYRKKYWDEIRGDDIPDQEIAEELLDTGVNCGMDTAKKILQDTLNVLNVKATKYPDLVVDGIMGPKTIQVLRQALAVAPWYRLCILRALDSQQCVRYIELSRKNERYESFMPGWLRTRVGVRDRTVRSGGPDPAGASC